MRGDVSKPGPTAPVACLESDFWNTERGTPQPGVIPSDPLPKVEFAKSPVLNKPGKRNQTRTHFTPAEAKEN